MGVYKGNKNDILVIEHFKAREISYKIIVDFNC